MESKWFIRYKTEQTEEPYKLPDYVKMELDTIAGLKIEYESPTEPIVIASVPNNKLGDVVSLDSVVDVYWDINFSPMS